MEDTKQEILKNCDDLSSYEKLELRNDTEERHISYIFLWKSGKQHKKLKVDFKNDFTTDDDRYTKNRQGTLMLQKNTPSPA